MDVGIECRELRGAMVAVLVVLHCGCCSQRLGCAARERKLAKGLAPWLGKSEGFSS